MFTDDDYARLARADGGGGKHGDTPTDNSWRQLAEEQEREKVREGVEAGGSGNCRKTRRKIASETFFLQARERRREREGER